MTANSESVTSFEVPVNMKTIVVVAVAAVVLSALFTTAFTGTVTFSNNDFQDQTIPVCPESHSHAFNGGEHCCSRWTIYPKFWHIWKHQLPTMTNVSDGFWIGEAGFLGIARILDLTKALRTLKLMSSVLRWKPNGGVSLVESTSQTFKSATAIAGPVQMTIIF